MKSSVYRVDRSGRLTAERKVQPDATLRRVTEPYYNEKSWAELKRGCEKLSLQG